MKLVNLHIERAPSYDEVAPNLLVGKVQLEGENGKMEVRLSNATVSEIFTMIKSDVARVAKQNAGEADHAIEQAESEMHLIEHQEQEDV